MSASPQEREAERSPMLAIGLKVSSVIAFVTMASLIKASGKLPAGEIVFFRSLFAVPPILMWLAWRGQLKGALATERPWSHALRGFVGVSAMGLGFFGLTRLPFPDAIALGYVKPLLVVVFSALFLGEVVRIYRWSAVVIGLIGVTLISWPKLTVITSPGGLANDEALGVLATLGSAFLAVIATLTVSSLVKTERTPTIVIRFSLTACVVALFTLPFGWEWLTPAAFALLAAAGFFGGLGQIMLTQSYRYAGMSVIAPFEYASMILSVVIGYFAFAELPTAWTVSGGSIVMASGIFIILREHRLGVERAASRKHQTALN